MTVLKNCSSCAPHTRRKRHKTTTRPCPPKPHNQQPQLHTNTSNSVHRTPRHLLPKSTRASTSHDRRILPAEYLFSMKAIFLSDAGADPVSAPFLRPDHPSPALLMQGKIPRAGGFRPSCCCYHPWCTDLSRSCPASAGVETRRYPSPDDASPAARPFRLPPLPPPPPCCHSAGASVAFRGFQEATGSRPAG